MFVKHPQDALTFRDFASQLRGSHFLTVWQVLLFLNCLILWLDKIVKINSCQTRRPFREV